MMFWVDRDITFHNVVLEEKKLLPNYSGQLGSLLYLKWSSIIERFYQILKKQFECPYIFAI